MFFLSGFLECSISLEKHVYNKSLKGLEKYLNFTFLIGLSSVNRKLYRYKYRHSNFILVFEYEYLPLSQASIPERIVLFPIGFIIFLIEN